MLRLTRAQNQTHDYCCTSLKKFVGEKAKFSKNL
jgi:hypothetical protein